MPRRIGTLSCRSTEDPPDPEEYPAQERSAETKSDCFGGQMASMTGARQPRNLIAINLSRELSTQPKGRSCEVCAADKVPLLSSG